MIYLLLKENDNNLVLWMKKCCIHMLNHRNYAPFFGKCKIVENSKK